MPGNEVARSRVVRRGVDGVQEAAAARRTIRRRSAWRRPPVTRASGCTAPITRLAGRRPHPGSNTTQASAGSDGSGSGSADDDGGKPAYRDEDGHVHGPGGPCSSANRRTATRPAITCLRKSVWFAAGNIEHGRQFRAVPAFQVGRPGTRGAASPSTAAPSSTRRRLSAKRAVAGKSVIFLLLVGERQTTPSGSTPSTSR